jgi:hypothetical protein
MAPDEGRVKPEPSRGPHGADRHEARESLAIQGARGGRPRRVHVAVSRRRYQFVARRLVRLLPGTPFRTRATGRTGVFLGELPLGGLLVRFAGENIPVEIHPDFLVSVLEAAA